MSYLDSSGVSAMWTKVKEYADSKKPPVATTTTAGVVKVGDGLSVTSDGVLNNNAASMITDAFQSGKAYTTGDLVIADNTLYKCIANTDGTIGVNNTTYFEKSTLKKEFDAKSITIDKLFEKGYSPVNTGYISKPYGNSYYYSEVKIDISKYSVLFIGDFSQQFFYFYNQHTDDPNYTPYIRQIADTDTLGYSYVQGTNIGKYKYGGSSYYGRVCIKDENTVLFTCDRNTANFSVGDVMFSTEKAIYGLAFGNLVKKNL